MKTARFTPSTPFGEEVNIFVTELLCSQLFPSLIDNPAFQHLLHSNGSADTMQCKQCVRCITLASFHVDLLGMALHKRHLFCLGEGRGWRSCSQTISMSNLEQSNNEEYPGNPRDRWQRFYYHRLAWDIQAQWIEYDQEAGMVTTPESGNQHGC